MATPDHDPEWFPVLLDYQERKAFPDCPRQVPWSKIAPHEKQALGNHGNQSLRRLAERGGLSPSEIRCAVEGRGLREIFRATAIASREKHEAFERGAIDWLIEWLKPEPAPAHPPSTLLGTTVIFRIRDARESCDRAAIVIGESSDDVVSLAILHDEDDALIGGLSESPFARSRCLVERVYRISLDESAEPKTRTWCPIPRPEIELQNIELQGLKERLRQIERQVDLLTLRSERT